MDSQIHFFGEGEGMLDLVSTRYFNRLWGLHKVPSWDHAIYLTIALLVTETHITFFVNKFLILLKIIPSCPFTGLNQSNNSETQTCPTGNVTLVSQYSLLDSTTAVGYSQKTAIAIQNQKYKYLKFGFMIPSEKNSQPKIVRLRRVNT